MTSLKSCPKTSTKSNDDTTATLPSFGVSINPWRYRAVDAIVTRFNIYSAFAHGQHGLGETVYTDDRASYKGIPYPHKAVKHSVSEYVKDQAHTNGIESFWATLKRGYHGTYHHVSEKHLSRYVAEFEGRHNSRPADTVKQIASIVRGMDGKRLRYQDLVA